MDISRNSPIVGAAGGVVAGPLLYGWIDAPREFVSWYAYQIAVLTPALAMFLVTAVQVFQQKIEEVRRDLRSLTWGSLFMISSGISGAATNLVRYESPTAANFGIAVGAGTLLAVLLSKMVFRERIAV